jgi:hypothetical protein
MCMCGSSKADLVGARRQRAARRSSIVGVSGGRRCMHARASRVLSSHIGVVSCRSMLCLTILNSAHVIVMCVSECTRRV